MTEEQVETPSPIIGMLRADFIGALMLGATIGFATWGIGMLLDRFVFGAYLCRGDNLSQCTNAQNYSAILASCVVLIGALAGLIRLRVYRPLLVLIASTISLWGIVQYSWQFSFYTGLLIVVVLYALSIGLFTWVARIREFWIALLVTIIVTVIVRLAFTSW